MGGLSHTVSGDIASFRTPSRVPIESLKFHFLPKQAAGTPSPENPIPIEGWTGMNGFQECVVYPFVQGGLADATGLPSGSGSNRIRTNDFIPCDAENFKIIDGKAEFDDFIRAVYFYDENQEYINSTMLGNVQFPCSWKTSIPSKTKYVKIVMWKSDRTSNISPTNKCVIIKPDNTYKIPITFPDGETIYGGYYDPIVGEIVAEYYLARAKKSDFGNKSTPSGTGRDYRQTQSIFPKTASGVQWATARQQQKFNRGIIANPWSEASYGENIGIIATQTQDSMNPPITYMRISEEVYQAMNDDDYAEISYKLREPIHIPIPAEDLQAFLDHNNFWSDANDITEVTYAVTESKDMLATRKKAMAFDIGHRKKVRWNQLIVDGQFTDASKWATNANYGSVSVNNNIGTWTCTVTPDYYYKTGITESREHLNIPETHKILMRATVRSSVAIRIALYALALGNEHSNPYYQDITVNEWTTIFGFVVQRNAGKFFAKGKICYGASSQNIGNIVPGTMLEAKDFMMFDLTQMFGLGNEPSTVAEFERICELNGIDLTTYQPYDTGSDRWLIIP